MVLCKFEGGCIKRASCNYQNIKSVMYCGTHKLSGMVITFANRCSEENCIKIANWNYQDKTKGLYCVLHKKEDMYDLKNKGCQHFSCKTGASFNYPGLSARLYCGVHRLEDMVDNKTIKCIESGCGSQASHELYCGKHSNGIKNTKTKRCIEENCDIIPTFNLKDEITRLYCKLHAKKDMVDISHKMCKYASCEIRPHFNLPRETELLFCKLHKTNDMIDVYHKRCILCNDIRISNPIYKNHCLRCFMYTFPDVEICRNYKLKENYVTDFIKEKFSKINFIFDKAIVGGCSRRRPDIFLDLFTHTIVVENDENQHDIHERICENKRSMQLFIDLGSRPIVFIRFNPDGYILDNKKICSSFVPNKTNGILRIRNKNEWNSRLSTLKKCISKWIKNIPEKEVTEEFLFYDN